MGRARWHFNSSSPTECRSTKNAKIRPLHLTHHPLKDWWAAVVLGLGNTGWSHFPSPTSTTNSKPRSSLGADTLSPDHWASLASSRSALSQRSGSKWLPAPQSRCYNCGFVSFWRSGVSFSPYEAAQQLEANATRRLISSSWGDKTPKETAAAQLVRKVDASIKTASLSHKKKKKLTHQACQCQYAAPYE